MHASERLACTAAQVFTQEARRDIGYYIMPRSVYPHGMLTEQVYSGDPELALYLEELHLSPDTFNPAWIHANYRQGSPGCRSDCCSPDTASCGCMCSCYQSHMWPSACDVRYEDLAL